MIVVPKYAFGPSEASPAAGHAGRVLMPADEPLRRRRKRHCRRHRPRSCFHRCSERHRANRGRQRTHGAGDCHQRCGGRQESRCGLSARHCKLEFATLPRRLRAASRPQQGLAVA